MISEASQTGYFIGIEREALRCDGSGKLSTKPHPTEFGNRMENRFITTDFGEAQLEIRTPVCDSPKSCYEKLYHTTHTVLYILGKRGEYLWPYSMPCQIPEEKDFVYNDYSGYPKEEEYEKYLADKYGYKRLCISGVHFNFSVTEELLSKMRKHYPEIPDDIDEAYFRCMRGFIASQSIFRIFYDASPTDLDAEFIRDPSFRNGPCGYRNGLENYVDYSCKEAYIRSIEKLLEEGRIARAGELYIPIRAKGNTELPQLEGLRNHPVDHIEIRLCDVDPFDICGISEENIAFATAYLLCCMALGESVPKETEGFLSECGRLSSILEVFPGEGIQHAIRVLKHKRFLSELIRMKLRENSNYFICLAKAYTEKVNMWPFSFREYSGLEPSTKMLLCDALMLGIDYRIIDEAKCIVELSGVSKKEIIVQATRTNRDSYIFEYVTSDKAYVMQQLGKVGIRTPKTKVFSKREYESGLFDIGTFCDAPFVVKPKSTNYGIGITIFKAPPDLEMAKRALKEAFSYDDTVLVQEYIPGKEYRFFIIAGKCRSVVNRRPACVRGDGNHTIGELITMKNETPRFKRWDKTLLINATSFDLLKKAGMTLESIPKAGETVYLQEATNASIGGETIDVTDEMPVRFHRIAEKTADLFHAFICGVDIIIPDCDKEYYSVLEINDNPGMFINEVPCEGKERRLGQQILKELGLI